MAICKRREREEYEKDYMGKREYAISDSIESI